MSIDTSCGWFLTYGYRIEANIPSNWEEKTSRLVSQTVWTDGLVKAL